MWFFRRRKPRPPKLCMGCGERPVTVPISGLCAKCAAEAQAFSP